MFPGPIGFTLQIFLQIPYGFWISALSYSLISFLFAFSGEVNLLIKLLFVRRENIERPSVVVGLLETILGLMSWFQGLLSVSS